MIRGGWVYPTGDVLQVMWPGFLMVTLLYCWHGDQQLEVPDEDCMTVLLEATHAVLSPSTVIL